MGRRTAGLLLVASLNAGNVDAEPLPDPLEAFADSVMSAQLAKYSIPGAVLAVVRDGRVAFVRGYGYANAERHEKVDPERTTFRVASVSKLITATAALQAVERGRLDLHSDVNLYLEQFKVPATYAKPITLFDLLTHTAGFDESYLARKTHSPSDLEPLGAYLSRDLPPRVRPPGEFIAYSNHGYALVGHLVEVVSDGRPFADIVRENIFAPLGMTHSGFEPSPVAGAIAATGYEDTPPRPLPPDYTRTIPASMLSSSGADMARFMAAHLNDGVLDGSRILGDSLARAMKQRQFSQDARIPGVCFGFWEIIRNGQRGVWHDGDADGFASLLYLIPERRTGFFMAFNSRNGNPARGETLAALRNHESPPAAGTVPGTTGSAASLARFAGTWLDLRHVHRSLGKTVSLIQGRIETKTTPDGALLLGGQRYVPIGENLFQGENGNGLVGFGVDHAGRVTHMFDSRSLAHVYERVPWYGTLVAQLGWLTLCLLGFLVPLLAASIGALVRRIRRLPAAPRSPGPRSVRRAALAAALTNFVFLLGFSGSIAGLFGPLQYGVPPILYVVLALPWIALALALFAAVRLVATRGSGVLSSIAVAASIALVPWLVYWNLLGWHL
jgi:CubicO group peptidase (beta-lactamase class C family)